jgi:hypothetical protein
MVKKYLKYIGLQRDKLSINEAEKKETYSPATDIKVAERYLTYLKEIDNYQKDRRTTIENKNSQLVGQASIVTSIFALFVPLLIGSFNGISYYIKIPLTIIFLLVLSHYLLTIYHATKTLKINRYKYATRRSSTVTKIKRENTELGFLNEEIKDLVYTVNQTEPIDNQKGENLIFGTRCFEVANFGFGIMTILIILSTFAINKEVPEVKVKNLNEINFTVPDTLNTRIINSQKIDSLTIKNDSLNNKIRTVSIKK